VATSSTLPLPIFNESIDGEVCQFLRCGLGECASEFENAELRLISVLPPDEGLQIACSQFWSVIAEGQKCCPELLLHHFEFIFWNVAAKHLFTSPYGLLSRSTSIVWSH